LVLRHPLPTPTNVNLLVLGTKFIMRSRRQRRIRRRLARNLPRRIKAKLPRK